MIEVSLKFDPCTGNEPLEEKVKLPIMPRKGDMIEVWVKHSADEPPLPKDDPRATMDELQIAASTMKEAYRFRQDETAYLKVDQILLTADPEGSDYIQVWVEPENMYELDEIRRVFLALRRGEQP